MTVSTTASPEQALAAFAPRVQAIKDGIQGETAREVPSFTHLLGFKADAAALNAEITTYIDAHRDENGAIDAPSRPYNDPDTRTPQQVAMRHLVDLANWLHSEPKEALNGCGVIPVGTFVSFQTKTNWGSDYKYDKGTVTKVTDNSYVVTKEGGSTARLDRYSAHQSSYGYGGGRGLTVVRTADEQRVWAAEEAVRQAEAAERYRASIERGNAISAVHQAQREQAYLLEYARQIARADVLRAFAEEVETLALQHLTDLSQDAPGREETTLAPEYATETA